MRSFISHFSAWIAALVCVAIIELWFNHTFHPSRADRSNFVAYGLDNNFVPDQMEEILYEKLRFRHVEAPDFVQVGDSSGFFGIMPEVVEQYLPGMKYLNESCCATQGFQGYLALLRYNLRRFPSIKYIVVYSGMLAAGPGPTQWRGQPQILNYGAVPLKTLGDKMETTLNPPWSLLDLPTNSLRMDVLQDTFLQEESRKVVNLRNGRFAIIIDGLQSRQGYGLEMDQQTGVGDFGPDMPKCSNSAFSYETLYDWRSLHQESYLDAFAEEYVALAREFDVIPVLMFQITPCSDPGSKGVMEMRADLKRLQRRFPELKVPVDIIDPYPGNEFSVPLHAQRGVAIEVSRRLGRALHDIVFPDDKIKTEVASPDSTLTVMRATRADTCLNQADLTQAFDAKCNGEAVCSIDLNQWRQAPENGACKSTYIAEFRCTGGPARIIRQETEDRFRGRFKLDCRLHDRWPRDPIPRGMELADATFNGQGGTPIGLETLRVKAFCDGLLSCDYSVEPPDHSTSSANIPGEFTVRWYCGAAEKKVHFSHVESGQILHLACQ